MSTHHFIASKDFNRKTLSALTKRGVAVIGWTFVPGLDGSYANGERFYNIDDNGMGRVVSFGAVREMAGA